MLILAEWLTTDIQTLVGLLAHGTNCLGCLAETDKSLCCTDYEATYVLTAVWMSIR